jgi:integrase
VGVSIETLPNGKFRAVVRFKGQPKRNGPTRPTKDEARQDEARLMIELGATGEAVPGVTVHYLVGDQLTHGGYAASSREPMKYAVRAMPAELLAMRAADLTTPVLYRHLESIESVEYRRKARNIISKAYKRGMKLGLVAHNPAAPIGSPTPDTAEVVPPTPEDVAALIKVARDVNPSLGVFVRLAAHLGVRRGELIGLQWADLTDSPALKIRRSIATDKRVVTPTKTGQRSHRTLSISEAVRDELLTLPRYDGQPWMFTHGDGPWRPGYITTAMGRLSDDSLHSLRHFCATQMLAKGFSLADVAHRLGDSIATVSRVYVHHVPDRDRQAAEALPF